ncbi:hypothetical protein EDD18DRAFT_1102687 [Armillaria luteobubalina]|uniref:Secreted protein n=1 Tax=Armillaria luteobubalina TaxID=153913 RepID=A0AA39QAL7_9AGAR|nr:hypothetical protein EDD18DRAFT_1102687 [Armillaria luteobubalina]
MMPAQSCMLLETAQFLLVVLGSMWLLLSASLETATLAMSCAPVCAAHRDVVQFPPSNTQYTAPIGSDDDSAVMLDADNEVVFAPSCYLSQCTHVSTTLLRRTMGAPMQPCHLRVTIMTVLCLLLLYPMHW